MYSFCHPSAPAGSLAYSSHMAYHSVCEICIEMTLFASEFDSRFYLAVVIFVSFGLKPLPNIEQSFLRLHVFRIRRRVSPHPANFLQKPRKRLDKNEISRVLILPPWRFRNPSFLLFRSSSRL